MNVSVPHSFQQGAVVSIPNLSKISRQNTLRLLNPEP